VKKWKENDVVFVLDRLQVPGNTRPLKLKFNPSPYLVVKCLYSTSLLRRLSDNFMALYSNDHIKKYNGADPLFATVPPEISKILLNKFEDFLAEDFTTITKFDNFEIPEGIPLYDPQDEWKNYSQKDEFQDENNGLEEETPNMEPKIGEIEDEFSPEMPEGNDNSQVLHTKVDLPSRSLIEKDLQDLQEDADGPGRPLDEADPEEAVDAPQAKRDEPLSDEDVSDEETEGRKLRSNRTKTVRFQPETRYRTRYRK
jgi:hypothetical protein